MKPTKLLLGLFVAILLSSYIAVYKWAVAKTEAQHSEDTARVVEQALLDYQEEISNANKKNTDLEKKADSAKRRIEQLHHRLDSHDSSCGVSSAVIGLLNEAISDPALQPSSDTPFIIKEGDSIESYCLYAIGEANRVKIKDNELIDETQP